MNRLLEIGFQSAGHWLLADEKLKLNLTRHASQANILYAFVCDGEVMYVGKTIRTLATRMAGYRSPAKSQTINVNNNQRIVEILKRGAAVEIPWNGGKPEKALNTDIEVSGQFEELVPLPIAAFQFILQSTYFRTGFFNVGVSSQQYIGSDGETIELF